MARLRPRRATRSRAGSARAGASAHRRRRAVRVPGPDVPHAPHQSARRAQEARADAVRSQPRRSRQRVGPRRTRDPRRRGADRPRGRHVRQRHPVRRSAPAARRRQLDAFAARSRRDAARATDGRERLLPLRQRRSGRLARRGEREAPRERHQRVRRCSREPSHRSAGPRARPGLRTLGHRHGSPRQADRRCRSDRAPAHAEQPRRRPRRSRWPVRRRRQRTVDAHGPGRQVLPRASARFAARPVGAEEGLPLGIARGARSRADAAALRHARRRPRDPRRRHRRTVDEARRALCGHGAVRARVAGRRPDRAGHACADGADARGQPRRSDAQPTAHAHGDDAPADARQRRADGIRWQRHARPRRARWTRREARATRGRRVRRDRPARRRLCSAHRVRRARDVPQRRSRTAPRRACAATADRADPRFHGRGHREGQQRQAARQGARRTAARGRAAGCDARARRGERRATGRGSGRNGARRTWRPRWTRRLPRTARCMARRATATSHDQREGRVRDRARAARPVRRASEPERARRREDGAVRARGRRVWHCAVAAAARHPVRPHPRRDQDRAGTSPRRRGTRWRRRRRRRDVPLRQPVRVRVARWHVSLRRTEGRRLRGARVPRQLDARPHGAIPTR